MGEFKHCDDYIDDETQPEVLRKFLDYARSPAHERAIDDLLECFAEYGDHDRAAMAYVLDQHFPAIAAVMEDTGWQDIATAEIEQYEQNPGVLVFVPEVGQMIARYGKSNDGEYDWFPLDQCCTIRPTHWMPLPPPPFEGESHDRR
jgi:hypothetical protein